MVRLIIPIPEKSEQLPFLVDRHHKSTYTVCALMISAESDIERRALP